MSQLEFGIITYTGMRHGKICNNCFGIASHWLREWPITEWSNANPKEIQFHLMLKWKLLYFTLNSSHKPDPKTKTHNSTFLAMHFQTFLLFFLQSQSGTFNIDLCLWEVVSDNSMCKVWQYTILYEYFYARTLMNSTDSPSTSYTRPNQTVWWTGLKDLLANSYYWE